MIDRIQGTSYYGQPKTYEKKVKSNTETFSMESEAQKSIPEKEEKKKARTADASVIENLLSKEEDSSGGVELDISNHGKEASEDLEHTAVRSGDALFERLKTLWSDIKAALVRFFQSGVEVIPEHEMTVEETTPEEPESVETDPFRAQEQMREELLQQLYGQGERTLAKNSDLLTSYDKHGSIVKMNAGDKNRILHVHPHHIDEKF